MAQGVGPESVDRWVQTASLLHSNGDAMDIAVKDNRMVGVRGRAGDRTTMVGWVRRTFTAGRRMLPRIG